MENDNSRIAPEATTDYAQEIARGDVLREIPSGAHVLMPADYDPETVTPEDCAHDWALRLVPGHCLTARSSS